MEDLQIYKVIIQTWTYLFVLRYFHNWINKLGKLGPQNAVWSQTGGYLKDINNVKQYEIILSFDDSLLIQFLK